MLWCKNKVATDNPDSKAKGLQCRKRYTSLENCIMGACIADIDDIKHTGVCRLQDRDTSVCRIGDIANDVVTEILRVCAGTENERPALLIPTLHPTYLGQTFVLDIASPGFVHKDLSEDILNKAWENVRQYAARCIKSWVDRFPARDYFTSLKVLDASTRFGQDLIGNAAWP